MLALLSVWLGLASLAYAVAIVVHRPLFTDVGVAATLYSAIFSLTFAGMTWWSLRKDGSGVPGVRARRAQAGVGSCLSLVGVAIIYLLIHLAERVPRGS